MEFQERINCNYQAEMFVLFPVDARKHITKWSGDGPFMHIFWENWEQHQQHDDHSCCD